MVGEAADRYSAKTGYSEHQTGLTFDLIDTSGNLVTEPGPSKWLLRMLLNMACGSLRRRKESDRHAESWHLHISEKKRKDIADSQVESLERLWLHRWGLR